MRWKSKCVTYIIWYIDFSNLFCFFCVKNCQLVCVSSCCYIRSIGWPWCIPIVNYWWNFRCRSWCPNVPQINKFVGSDDSKSLIIDWIPYDMLQSMSKRQCLNSTKISRRFELTNFYQFVRETCTKILAIATPIARSQKFVMNPQVFRHVLYIRLLHRCESE